MELLDQYLETIKTFLPKGQQDDIIRELSENLLSQMEDREAELGRPLTEAEQEAILQQHGNPMVVAGRYQNQKRSVAFGRQLIGPVLFPLYIKILSLNLGLTAIVVLIISFAMGKGLDLGTLIQNGLLQLAILTVIFSLVEKHLLKSKDRWDPKDFGLKTKDRPVPMMWMAAFSRTFAGNNELKVPRSESIAAIIFNLVFISWITIPSWPLRTMLGAADSVLRVGTGLKVVYLPILFLSLAGMVQPLVNLFRPEWVWLRAAWRTVSAAIFVAVLGFSLKAGNWVVLAAGASDKLAEHQHAIEVINHWCRIGVTIGVVASTIAFLVELWRLLHRRSHHRLTATNANGMQLS